MKQQHRTLVIIFAVLATGIVAAWLLLPSGFFFGTQGDPASESGKWAVWQEANSCITLAVADTPRLRRQGLSNRQGLSAYEGMLFIYDLRGEYGFWMKDMNFSIDIIWLDGENQVVTVKHAVTPDTYPEVFYPADYAKKVIEVPAGVAQALEVKIGDVLNVSAPTTTPPVDCAML